VNWEEMLNLKKFKKPLKRLGYSWGGTQISSRAGAQFESEVVTTSMKEEFEKDGIVFTAQIPLLKEIPRDFQKTLWQRLWPPKNNKLAALNSGDLVRRYVLFMCQKACVVMSVNQNVL